MRSTKELNETIGAGAVAAAGSVRRMAVTLTGTTTIAKLQWQMTGVRMLDNKPEIQNYEVFAGVGIAARPPTSGKPEAIVIGPADGAVAIAVRDAKTQVQIAGDLKADETKLFNSKAFLHMKDSGDAVAKKPNESDDYVALKRDLARLKTAITNATTLSAADFKASLLAALNDLPAWPEGSTTLKGGH